MVRNERTRARAFLVVSVRGFFFCVLSYVFALARRDYVDEDTSWHFAIGTRQSQDSMATRCPCALNKCENSACIAQRASTISTFLLRLLRERRVSYAYAYNRDQRLSRFSSLPPGSVSLSLSLDAV